jgi:hypothetical protein
MKKEGTWTTEDYDDISWHDCHVYGFHLENFVPDEGSADLVLDIDYIMKWGEEKDDFVFTVCQATLRFHDVFMLKMSLDYVTPTAGVCPFSMADIEREELIFPNGYKSFRWNIPLNWPRGEISFQSPGFTQKMVGSPHIQDDQIIAEELRVWK